MTNMKAKMTQPQEWWGSLSNGERCLIWSMMKLLRGAKRSEVEEVARAAAKWESGIGCFIKVRLMSMATKGRRVESGWLKVEGQRGLKGPRDHQTQSTPLPASGHLLPNAEKGISPPEAERVRAKGAA